MGTSFQTSARLHATPKSKDIMSRFTLTTLALVAFACTANAAKTYSGTPETLGVSINTGGNDCSSAKVYKAGVDEITVTWSNVSAVIDSKVTVKMCFDKSLGLIVDS